MNLSHIIEGHPDDAVALVSRGRETTYGTLRGQVAGLRGGLVELGLRPGARVGILCENNRYFVVSYLAVLGAGLVAVPLNASSPPLALTEELRVTGAAAAIVGPSARAAISGIDRSRLEDLEVVVGCGFSVDGGPTFEDLIAHDPAPVVEVEPDTLAALMFTSGTAGAPKAAMLSHGNLEVNIRQTRASGTYGQQRDQGGDVVLGVTPLQHIFGLNVVLGASLAAGSAVVLIERFDPMSALESMVKHKVTLAAGPPSMWAAWLGLPSLPADIFSHLRVAVSGAARLPEQVTEAYRERFGLALSEGYGLTEASPTVTASTGTEAPSGSIGIPVPGVEVRLVDEDGSDVYIGDPGEILVRGPNVFVGYWNNPEATAAVLDPQGWLHTGDIAVVDDDGFLFIVDRRKDLIIVSGFNVYPGEVEKALQSHPGVSAVAVIGVPHPHTGESVLAYVVPEAGWVLEEEQLIEHCRSRLARYKCPKKFWFVDSIPQDLGGKVLRRILREQGASSDTPS